MKKIVAIAAIFIMIGSASALKPPTPPDPSQDGTDLGGNHPVPIGTATALLVTLGAGVTAYKLRKSHKEEK